MVSGLHRMCPAGTAGRNGCWQRLPVCIHAIANTGLPSAATACADTPDTPDGPMDGGALLQDTPRRRALGAAGAGGGGGSWSLLSPLDAADHLHAALRIRVCRHPRHPGRQLSGQH